MALVSQSAFARQIGKTPQYVYRLIKRGVIPSRPDKRVDSKRALESLAAIQDPIKAAVRDDGRQESGGTNLSAQLLKARVKAEIERGKALELDRRAREKELIEAAEVEARWATFGVLFREAVMGMKARVCNRLPEEWRRQASAVMDEEARNILTSLADDIRAA